MKLTDDCFQNDPESFQRWRAMYVRLWQWDLLSTADLELLLISGDADLPSDAELRRNKGDCVYLIQFLLYQLLESDHLISDLPGGVRGHA